MSAGTVSVAQPAAIDPCLYRIRDLIYRAAGIYQPDTSFASSPTVVAAACRYCG